MVASTVMRRTLIGNQCANEAPINGRRDLTRIDPYGGRNSSIEATGRTGMGREQRMPTATEATVGIHLTRWCRSLARQSSARFQSGLRDRTQGIVQPVSGDAGGGVSVGVGLGHAGDTSVALCIRSGDRLRGRV